MGVFGGNPHPDAFVLHQNPVVNHQQGNARQGEAMAVQQNNADQGDAMELDAEEDEDEDEWLAWNPTPIVANNVQVIPHHIAVPQDHLHLSLSGSSM